MQFDTYLVLLTCYNICCRLTRSVWPSDLKKPENLRPVATVPRMYESEETKEPDDVTGMTIRYANSSVFLY